MLQRPPWPAEGRDAALHGDPRAREGGEVLRGADEGGSGEDRRTGIGKGPESFMRPRQCAAKGRRGQYLGCCIYLSSLFNSDGEVFRYSGSRWAPLMASSKRFFGGTPVIPFGVR